MLKPVKNTDTAEEKGYDAGKKVSGIKRHIAVDMQGLPHALSVTTANVSDREGRFLCSMLVQRTLRILEKILFDGGYRGEESAKKFKKFVLPSRSCQKKWTAYSLPLSQKMGRWTFFRLAKKKKKSETLEKPERHLSLLAMMQLAFIAPPPKKKKKRS